MFSISVVIIAKNEGKNIAKALDSVKSWAKDIVVVDDFSDDDTVEVAGKYTDKVFKRKMDIEGRHRNWAYSRASSEWVLSLDADEVVTDGLKKEIERTIASDTEFAAFSIPLRTYIGDYWVRYGGWYPANKLRLFKRDKFRYEEAVVHPRTILDGRCGLLTKDIIHYGYADLTELFASLNGQTKLEAEKWLSDKRKMSSFRAFRKSTDRFIKSYVLKRGYKDGFMGFAVSLNSALYQMMSYLKYLEMKKNEKQREL